MLSIVVVTRQCYFNNRLSEFSVFTFFLQLKGTRSLTSIAYSLSLWKTLTLVWLGISQYSYRQVCIQPPMSAVNMTLPAFVGQRGTCCTAPLLLSACYWSISSAHRVLSCKPTARRCCCRSTGRTDERTGQGRGGTASPTFLDWNSCKS